MYKFDRNHQFTLSDFNQPVGLKMNPENRWVKKAAAISWNEIEEKYAALFPGKNGMPAKLLRTALGYLVIQKQYGYSDRELVEQIRENPYYQCEHQPAVHSPNRSRKNKIPGGVWCKA